MHNRYKVRLDQECMFKTTSHLLGDVIRGMGKRSGSTWINAFKMTCRLHVYVECETNSRLGSTWKRNFACEMTARLGSTKDECRFVRNDRSFIETISFARWKRGQTRPWLNALISNTNLSLEWNDESFQAANVVCWTWWERAWPYPMWSFTIQGRVWNK